MRSSKHRGVKLLKGAALAGLLAMTNATMAQDDDMSRISQLPLDVGGQVPGNLALVPSVEFPTVISVANLGNYSHQTTYVGYFDSGKCYEYKTETFQHVYFGEQKASDNAGYFTPVRASSSCTGANEWSGNYLNWATTQTIDPFRKALTGGYRVVDEVGRTILEKATRAGRPDYFPARSVGKSVAEAVTPYSPEGNFTVALTQGTDYQKNKAFRVQYVEKEWVPGRRGGGSWEDVTRTHYFSVRVEVCKSASLLEDNCVRYGNNWKPEGLLQQYADSIRYSTFSYLNEDGNSRNGGVLRANQGYIGKTKREPGVYGETTNPDIEWNSETGVLHTNPKNAGEGNSGVINYINKFGELTNRHKSNDPVSELFYTALRYFKDQGNVASYSNNLTTERKDGFPVVTDWDDPVQYACQKNVVLGIGDVNSHEDRNLPVAGDDLALNAYTNKVFGLEGINKSASNVFTGRGNSAYIAGLAYYANTTDLRDDKPGKQTMQTYWVDVREGQQLLGKADNQYWLAAKYGGFKVPTDFGAALDREDGLEEGWWTVSGDVLESGDKRPDGFFVASDASNMIESLKKAFAAIAADMQLSSTATATNSTELQEGSKIYVATFRSRDWSGQLEAYELDAESGEREADSVWDTDVTMAGVDIDARVILTSKGLAGSGAVMRGVSFEWNALSVEQRDLLGSEDVLEWLRGSPVEGLRVREHLLGDVVNSNPAFVGAKDDYGYHRFATIAEASTYRAFLGRKKSRTDMLYVGANDGMLHAFSAETGVEQFAYVPAGVFANLNQLADPGYQHRYYVDGSPVAADAYIGNDWKTILVGTTGAGGKSVFALDVTDPTLVSASNVLWEFSTAADDEDQLGYSIGSPSIARIAAGNKWVVVLGNGYESGDDHLKLFLLDLATGEPVQVISTGESAADNGLASPTVVDSDGDGLADLAYAGDLQGNLWRFDLVAGDATKLFQAMDADADPQPITVQARVARHPEGGLIVIFGTGKFFQVGDGEPVVDPQVQTLYGIRDVDGALVERDDLLEQTIDFEGLAEFAGSGDTVFPIRVVSANMASAEAPVSGWYLDLQKPTGTDFPATSHVAQGERLVASPILRHGRVVFLTNISNDDPCVGGGYSWLMELDIYSGSRLSESVLDINGDGVIDENDMVKVGDQVLPVSGLRLDGLLDMPAVLRDGEDEIKCFGRSICIREKGDGIKAGRQSWRQLQ